MAAVLHHYQTVSVAGPGLSLAPIQLMVAKVYPYVEPITDLVEGSGLT